MAAYLQEGGDRRSLAARGERVAPPGAVAARRWAAEGVRGMWSSPGGAVGAPRGRSGCAAARMRRRPAPSEAPPRRRRSEDPRVRCVVPRGALGLTSSV